MSLRHTLYLLRHGETEWNAAGRLQGHTDVPLNDVGRAQARKAAELLDNLPLSWVVSSDLSRARETASIVASLLNLEIHVDTALRERCFGIFEGLTWDQVLTRHPEFHAAYMKDRNTPIPGAETMDVVAHRALGAVKVALAREPEQPILVVAHGGVMRALMWKVWQPPPGVKGVPNAIPFRVTVEDGQVVAAEALGLIES